MLAAGEPDPLSEEELWQRLDDMQQEAGKAVDDWFAAVRGAGLR
jgi:hypothetical protein